MLKESLWKFLSTSIFPLCFIAHANFTKVLWKVSYRSKNTICEKLSYFPISKIDIVKRNLASCSWSLPPIPLPPPSSPTSPSASNTKTPLTKLASSHMYHYNKFFILKHMFSICCSLSTLKILSKQCAAFLTCIQFQTFLFPHQELQIPKQRRKAVSNPQINFASNNLLRRPGIPAYFSMIFWDGSLSLSLFSFSDHSSFYSTSIGCFEVSGKGKNW